MKQETRIGLIETTLGLGVSFISTLSLYWVSLLQIKVFQGIAAFILVVTFILGLAFFKVGLDKLLNQKE